MHFLSNYHIKSKAVRDPLYTYIELPEVLLPIIDHKLIQRLRWISQLPLEQLVYPSAQHSRFEHSLGVMYLAMLAAVSLLTNSKEEINSYFQTDPDFKKLETLEEQEQNFILSAGLAGLLHDVGHAPFSHTLEEACKYVDIGYKYNHEHVGFELSKYLIKSTQLSDKIYSIKALQALNKNLKEDNSDLRPIEIIIRKIIDGPIDVDKGDYIYRDSYHCGTNYGYYDIQRLWRNICVVKDIYNLHVTTKGALEAWTLRFQRYKMYANIYKHHIRNITDAMLIDILASCFEHYRDDKQKLESLIPITDSLDDLGNKQTMFNFMTWTDNSLLKVISSLGIPASFRVDNFLSRVLYKPSIYYDLSNYPDLLFLVEDGYDIHLAIREIQKELHKSKRLNFDFLINKEELPPVYDSYVQEKIKVYNESGESWSLAEYLGFKLPNSSGSDNSSNGRFSLNYKIYLRFFISRDCRSMEHILKDRIDQFLEPYKRI